MRFERGAEILTVSAVSLMILAAFHPVFTSSPPGDPSLVASNMIKGSMVSSLTCTISTPLTPGSTGISRGDLIVVTTTDEANSPTYVSSINDGQGNAFTQVNSPGTTFGWDTTVYDDVSLGYAIAYFSGTSDSILVTYTAKVTAGIVACYDITGFTPQSHPFHTMTGVGSSPGVNAFTPVPEDLVFATAGWSYSCENAAVGSGYTRGEGGSAANSCQNDIEIGDEYNLSWVSGSTPAPQTLSPNSEAWGEVAVDFVPPAVTTTTTPTTVTSTTTATSTMTSTYTTYVSTTTVATTETITTTVSINPVSMSSAGASSSVTGSSQSGTSTGESSMGNTVAQSSTVGVSTGTSGSAVPSGSSTVSSGPLGTYPALALGIIVGLVVGVLGAAALLRVRLRRPQT